MQQLIIIMQNKIRKKSWFQRIFCCNVQQQILQVKKNKAYKTKKKYKIQLSLLGSVNYFKLCKISRKNISIDNFIDDSTIPVQVNRYLRNKINGTIAIIKGDISPSITKNIIYPIYLENNLTRVLKQEMVNLQQSYNIRQDEMCIFRPKQQNLIDIRNNLNNHTIKQIRQICKKYQKSVLIFPKSIIYDQIGIILADLKQKEVQIESLVINGSIFLIVVYVGSREFVKIKDQQILQFIVKQLKRDSNIETRSLQILIEELLKKSTILIILTLLVKSIQQADIDTILARFLRNVSDQHLIEFEFLQKIFKIGQSQYRSTPTLQFTAQFRQPSLQKLSTDSLKDQTLINKGSRILIHQNEVETQYDEEITLYGEELKCNMTKY